MVQFGKTVPVYQDDVSTYKLLTTVDGCLEYKSLEDEAVKDLFKEVRGDSYLVVTKETIFYPQGGGQPNDTGTMEQLETSSRGDSRAIFAVSAVRKVSEGTIFHLGTFSGPPGQPVIVFTAGQAVRQEISAEQRLLHSRIHTGGHVVGLAVRRLIQNGVIVGGGGGGEITELKAQHYPDAAFVEFRGLIDGSHKEAIAREANAIVVRDVAVVAHRWSLAEARERCVVVPEAVGIPADEMIRAVEVEGEGAYPCGGTYAQRSSVVGKVEIRKIKRQKGITKISYCVS